VPDDVWSKRGGNQHGQDVRLQPGVRGVRRVGLLRADGVQVLRRLRHRRVGQPFLQYSDGFGIDLGLLPPRNGVHQCPM
jgi:hypothetical protein